MTYKVKEVSTIAGVSVRTLHHYDEIGLLKPEFVTSAGYRLYSDRDLERLQQILFFKELDFDLQEIRDILSSPGFDRKSALKAHKELLIEKRKRLERIIQSVDKTIDSIGGGIEMSKKEMFESFDMSEIEKHQEKYAEEVKRKYGSTDAYKESQKKTAKYSKEDWARIIGRQGEIYRGLAGLMDREPSHPEVQELVAQARQQITENFYNCTPEIFAGLGEMYVNDERFTANIDKFKPGLAVFLRDAIRVYCNNIK
ncbi:MAG: MerR family transcriptional regulator [Bacillota bacterium]|nr:MerR family transcriptional regulator [Bacillota bacterium]